MIRRGLRRAVLYVPAHDVRKTHKAAGLGVDAICFDLEDGVALSRKCDARLGLKDALQLPTRSEVMVRVNAPNSEQFKDDISFLLTECKLPQTLVIPKVDQVSDLDWILDSNLGEDLKIMPIIESPLSMLNLDSILSYSERITGAIFGADDYAARVGAVRTKTNHEVSFARNWMLMHCAARNIDAIDQVFIDLSAPEAELALEAREGFELGFSGKQVIHPKQVPVVQDCFKPNAELLDFARRVIEEFDKHETDGTGAFVLDGKMIDMPTVKQCQNLLDKIS